MVERRTSPYNAPDDADIEALRALLAQRERRIDELEGELAALKQGPDKIPATPILRRAALAADAVAQRLTPAARIMQRCVVATANAVSSTGWFLIAALVIQLPLVLNLGYFNHDELQWLAQADQPSLEQVPWSAWFDFQPFQFRPLTFNLWLLVSHFFGYQPFVMHLLRVLCGIMVALLLRAVFVRMDMPARRSALAALFFLLLPEVAFTHAWIGTYADSLCLGFALCAMLWTLRAPGSLLAVAPPIALITALALLSKESAIVIPALLLVAAFKRRDRALIIAIASSALVVAAYLYLRLDTILFSPRDSGGYAWSLRNIPDRLGEYAIFPFLFDRLDASGSRWDHHLYFAVACLGVFLAALATAGWRYFAALCVGWIGAMGPTLILAYSANHYAYISAAFACGLVALAWDRLRMTARFAIAGLLVVASVHGVEVGKQMRHIGRVQHHLYKDLVVLVPQSLDVIRIKPERIQEEFILLRVLHAVPSYHRIPFGDRVIALPHAGGSDRPTYLMAGDGRLVRPH